MESSPTSQTSVDEERAEEGETVSLVREASEENEAKAEGVCASLSSPLHWFSMLADEMHWSFVFGVVTVYGISQGLGGAIWRVASDYYWKDVQMVQPSEAQVYQGITSLPWIVKPLWGLLTDVLPMAGYRRRPYFILSGKLYLHVFFALLALTVGSAGVAISDVTIDACVAQNSISHPTLAADMQTLCGFSASIGRLLGFSISGLLVHAIGSQGVLGLLSIPAALVFSVGILLKEIHTPNFSYGQVHEKFLQASRSMWTTLKYPYVWRPCLYMYVSLALSLKIQEGMFYWYTDKNSGPSFSQETVGFILSVGSVGSLLGVLLYQNLLKDCPFRNVLFWSQLLSSFAGMLDLVLVLRLNLKVGMPDYFFVVIDETQAMSPGIEGTFFALLMSIDNVGMLTSSWGGGLLLHILRVTRQDFSNLWGAILIRNIMRLLPLAFLFLVPKIDQHSAILPADILVENGSTKPCEAKTDDIELISLVNSSEVGVGKA
ncbi:hypothetical protein J5N97_026916 [Dioscorea zingiberensis]|uniref:Folate-biopterin transporter 2 n=1 Tax=Dioscorea zingiberensis TaxID=325984 RepID=A0A9D5H759_9LILI|nr:hypothetical protein J5N97_026916 [Dioscorea zingiberensis]